jgi:hypothetical protein
MPFGLKYLVSAAASSTESATGTNPSASEKTENDSNERGLAAAQSSR